MTSYNLSIPIIGSNTMFRIAREAKTCTVCLGCLNQFSFLWNETMQVFLANITSSYSENKEQFALSCQYILPSLKGNLKLHFAMRNSHANKRNQNPLPIPSLHPFKSLFALQMWKVWAPLLVKEPFKLMIIILLFLYL